MRHVRTALVTGAALVLAAGCSSGAKPASRSSQPPRAAISTAGRPAVVSQSAASNCPGLGALGDVSEVGKPFTNGRFRVTVKELRQTTTLKDGYAPEDIPDSKSTNGKYVLAILTVTNTGNEPAAFTGESAIYDGCGRQYKQDRGLVSDLRQPGDDLKSLADTTDVQTGSTRTGYIVFDVPAAVTPSLLFVQSEDEGYDHKASPSTPVDVAAR